MRRDTKEVLAELVGKLTEKLDPKKPQQRASEKSLSEVSFAPISIV
jgi:hypothetical protein